jgi:hypothetical protein
MTAENEISAQLLMLTSRYYTLCTDTYVIRGLFSSSSYVDYFVFKKPLRKISWIIFSQKVNFDCLIDYHYSKTSYRILFVIFKVGIINIRLFFFSHTKMAAVLFKYFQLFDNESLYYQIDTVSTLNFRDSLIQKKTRENDLPSTPN